MRARAARKHKPAAGAWWCAPVAGWPERLEIYNIARDETIVIRLDGDTKRRKRRKEPEPVARMWFRED